MVLLIVVTLALAPIVALYSYGQVARRDRGPESACLPVMPGLTMLDRTLASLLARYPAKTGLRMLTGNLEAFAARASSARNAERSLDLQYYYWHNDLTGRLLTAEVLAAADRGVRVRLLLDDINTRNRDRDYLALDAHPNIEVRLFNPCRNRSGPIRRALELIWRAYSATRRMHNKAWIVDGRLAIVGGRNIGDEYFDASEASNFRDMDLIAVGPAVAQTEAIFDSFWNSAVVAPIRRLAFGRRGDLAALRRTLGQLSSDPAAQPFLKRVVDDTSVRDLASGGGRMYWTDNARVISDLPEKALGGTDGWLIRTIQPLISGANREVRITSPYFIPGQRGTAQLSELVERGVSVSVLTNSLAATDVAAVHGAYARYRKPLLAAGVDLFELRQQEAAKPDMSLFGSRGASLHTKAFVVDDVTGFVGSFNFDPRSVSLNTEMGVVFENRELVAEMRDIFESEISPRRSYRVVLDKGALRWQGASGRLHATEPQASVWRRLAACLIGLLPLESQL